MKFIETLRALPLSRQLLLAAAVAGIVFAMSFMVQNATKEPMALLYSGLEPQYAGEIIEKLDQGGTPYEIKGGAIFIPESKRDGVRFALAKEGLPRQSVQGYELLDEVNGFSVTSEMYNASYWRAKEGELTRTRKLKRDFIEQRYGVLIEAMYADQPNTPIEIPVRYQDGRSGVLRADVTTGRVSSGLSNGDKNP